MALLMYSCSFHPERTLFHHGCVNLRACLCDVLQYVSAQLLDFIAMTKNALAPVRELPLCSDRIAG